jgi:hypothetical protein
MLLLLASRVTVPDHVGLAAMLLVAPLTYILLETLF